MAFNMIQKEIYRKGKLMVDFSVKSVRSVLSAIHFKVRYFVQENLQRVRKKEKRKKEIILTCERLNRFYAGIKGRWENSEIDSNCRLQFWRNWRSNKIIPKRKCGGLQVMNTKWLFIIAFQYAWFASVKFQSLRPAWKSVIYGDTRVHQRLSGDVW